MSLIPRWGDAIVIRRLSFSWWSLIYGIKALAMIPPNENPIIFTIVNFKLRCK